MKGADVIALTLKRLGVTVVFGIVGIPVVEVADACIAQGIRFIGFRNEQSASYAAGAWGYLSGEPGVCLVVSGPGVLHALPGLANAQVNCWPMLLLGGSCDTYQTGWGAFQELGQTEACRPYTKYAARPPTVDQIPQTLQTAFRHTINGRPGPAYVDLPADYIQAKLDPVSTVTTAETATGGGPNRAADPVAITQAIRKLRAARNPLVIVGKGAAYARVETDGVLEGLITRSGWPFLPTSMAKGLLPDDHPLCVGAARSQALAQADVVLLLGARVNWMLHFGQKFRSDVTLIQADVAAEEIGQNHPVAIALVGDLKAIVGQLNQALRQSSPASSSQLDNGPATITTATTTTTSNHTKLAQRYRVNDIPMTYHRAFAEIKRALEPVYRDQVVLVSEGANTMDIARTVFDLYQPRRRLDAGTFATMGVGMGFSIAAQLFYNPSSAQTPGELVKSAATQPGNRVVAIVGDSAFGFSAPEIETAVRAGLPLLVIVINNNGIYHGLDPHAYQKEVAQKGLALMPSTALSPDTRYDLLAEAMGARGYWVKTPDELFEAIQEAWVQPQVAVINCMIQPGGPQKLVSN
ncbi:thiamine pyrophosphate enzyme, N-terminal TPP binding domain-containing protein [Dimargaris cristalligena]|uniref:2-hydroxyacyl-CoA lyase n=1 Tax=Dimargaris cristalligena TaxID=215637 RepID=A0A4Q0A2V4_9FUNG|nr:thiamine pyrophosphate enzyme, N-terminal TPP binding domain-containing protein [Dimargaris cristalligena]|eukprot:RKP40455.1 thiamine pyrophosphate enzyme, N-terminal TPP binding domain-containing protein [Dimargaris cristalligena]